MRFQIKWSDAFAIPCDDALFQSEVTFRDPKMCAVLHKVGVEYVCRSVAPGFADKRAANVENSDKSSGGRSGASQHCGRRYGNRVCP